MLRNFLLSSAPDVLGDPVGDSRRLLKARSRSRAKVVLATLRVRAALLK